MSTATTATATGRSPVKWIMEQRHSAGYALAALPVIWDSYKAYRDRKNVPGAFAKSAFTNAWPLLLTRGMALEGLLQPALFLVPAAPALIAGVHSMVQMRNSYVRQATRPFSTRYEHSEFAYAAQQRGLQSISQTRSMVGAEAGAMAARYGRR